ncbi:MAG: glycoside hydrolase family 32 protein [Saprospiraceae bacterium]
MMKSTTLLLGICTLFVMSCKQVQPTTETEAYYAEPYRPQFHFSPQEKWMNDPNGMFYYNNEYHLFYQYYPDSTVWGPMHWGHAVSKDLVYWEHLPIALFPDEDGYIFSGSAVVDWKNTSGLGKDGQPPLIAIFTSHNAEQEKAGRIDFQAQSIAYSNDNGRTWTKYPDNPVLKNPGIRDFRDPKVSWHEATQQWIMTLAAQDHIAFYASPDLKNWTHQSDFGKDRGAHGGVWECPDLFPLQIAGTDQTKWVLLVSINPGGPNGGSATQYFIGNFDGKTFTSDDSASTTLWMDYGRDNYAGVTWSDVPREDGRRLLIGWMSNWQYAQVVPTERWRSAMTVSRELTLQNTPAGLRLVSKPVKELEQLRAKTSPVAAQAITGTVDITPQLGFAPTQMEAVLEFELSGDSLVNIGIELGNTKGEVYRIGYNAGAKTFYSDRTKAGKADFSELFNDKVTIAPRWINSNTVQLHLFFDKMSAELFADGGATVITDLYFPNEDYRQVKLFAENGTAQLKKATFYQLKSIWQ